MPALSTDMIEARPIVMRRVAWVVAAVIVVTFLVTAVVMRDANAGAKFTTTDQLGTAALGPMLAALVLVLTRPRMRADAAGVHLRGFFTSWRTIPWEAVQAVEFPSNIRFARLVLPGDEAVAIFAVQRIDREQSVEVMRGLRRLFAESHSS